jgi:hypothetical protein
VVIARGRGLTREPVPDLFAAVCSIAPTRRRRFLWAAWWTAPPARDPFRKPDAFNGGARTREEARLEAERVAGCALVEIEPRWARAWARVMLGQPPWNKPRAQPPPPGGSVFGSVPPRAREAARPSALSILGVEPTATLDEIKRAFRKRALETHPDRGGDAEAFRTVQRAYEQAVARRARPAKRRKR